MAEDAGAAVTAAWAAAAAAAWVAGAAAANVPARLASRGEGGSSPLLQFIHHPRENKRPWARIRSFFFISFLIDLSGETLPLLLHTPLKKDPHLLCKCALSQRCDM